ncbi:MAG: hypothetical protein MUC87_06885 [Bacteroidia bacterium]|jgi:hypothetical protein|nr:hypothetical protein [Bacteroidia bacterium]
MAQETPLQTINRILTTAQIIIDTNLSNLDGRPLPDGSYLPPTLTPKPNTWRKDLVDMNKNLKEATKKDIEKILENESFTSAQRNVIQKGIDHIFSDKSHESIYNQVQQFIKDQPQRSILSDKFNEKAERQWAEEKQNERPANKDDLSVTFNQNSQPPPGKDGLNRDNV